MVKEKKLEYERVDEKGDKVRKILVKFNPKFMRGSDFEIEFIPLVWATGLGNAFVTEIDTMSTMDLYQWVDRQTILHSGMEDFKCGTIISKKLNSDHAKLMTRALRQGRAIIEPRQIASRVKRVYEDVENEFGRPVAFTYNYFLYSGELGSLPPSNEGFNTEKLRKVIEEIPHRGFTSEGEEVERPFVEHLFDTHKTEYLRENIKWFLKGMEEIAKRAVEKYGEEVLG